MRARDVLNRTVSEAEFQDIVIGLFRQRKWEVDHRWDARHSSSKGFPDLIAIRAPRLVIAELKKTGGKTSAGQDWWLRELAKVADANSTLEIFTWWPEDWDEIQKVAG